MVLAFAILVVGAGLFAMFLLRPGQEPDLNHGGAVSVPADLLKTAPWTRGVDPHLPHKLIVGVDIEPGTYTTKGQLPAPDYQGACTWARLSGAEGRVSDVIASGETLGPLTITIAPTDKAFVTGGCQEWVGPS